MSIVITRWQLWIAKIGRKERKKFITAFGIPLKIESPAHAEELFNNHDDIDFDFLAKKLLNPTQSVFYNRARVTDFVILQQAANKASQERGGQDQLDSTIYWVDELIQQYKSGAADCFANALFVQ